METLTGKRFMIGIMGDELVQDLKERIQYVEGIPPYQQKIHLPVLSALFFKLNLHNSRASATTQWSLEMKKV